GSGGAERPPRTAAGVRSVAAWMRPLDATTLGAARSSGPPRRSVTRPPASSTSRSPPATSPGPSTSSQSPHSPPAAPAPWAHPQLPGPVHPSRRDRGQRDGGGAELAHAAILPRESGVLGEIGVGRVAHVVGKAGGEEARADLGGLGDGEPPSVEKRPGAPLGHEALAQARIVDHPDRHPPRDVDADGHQ